MRLSLALLSAALAPVAFANMAPPLPPPPPVTVEMYAITENGLAGKIGTIELKQTPVGLMFLPQLKGLPPGDHGFHVHEMGDCGPAMKDGKMTAGMAAGGHYDPDAHKAHLGPMGAGHRGDLEVLKVAADGTATQSALSGRLKLTDVAGHALMIHAGGDNYSDQPAPLGGGGARIACGIVPLKKTGQL